MKFPGHIFHFDHGRSLNIPSFDIRISETGKTKRICNIFSLLHYFYMERWRADENLISNRSAKIGA